MYQSEQAIGIFSIDDAQAVQPLAQELSSQFVLVTDTFVRFVQVTSVACAKVTEYMSIHIKVHRNLRKNLEKRLR